MMIGAGSTFLGKHVIQFCHILLKVFNLNGGTRAPAGAGTGARAWRWWGGLRRWWYDWASGGPGRRLAQPRCCAGCCSAPCGTEPARPGCAPPGPLLWVLSQAPQAPAATSLLRSFPPARPRRGWAASPEWASGTAAGGTDSCARRLHPAHTRDAANN